MTLALRYAARSDVGLVRQANEDSGYAAPHLLVVADGMGGHAAGELASATVVATLADLVDGDRLPLTDSDALPELESAVKAAGASIGQVITEEPDLAGMGTTLTGTYLLDDQLAIVHVGDSRAYLLRDGVLSQITHDHTYVQTLVDTGRITAEEAAVHPRRSLLMRAIDGSQPVEADLFLHDVRPGDRLLLCSDGLAGTVSDDELRELMSEGDPTGTVIACVDLALTRGAPDNVTVVVADVLDVDSTHVSDLTAGEPVVVGAAGEPRVRARLPRVHFPRDAQVDPNRPDPPPAFDGGPPTSELPFIDAAAAVPGSGAWSSRSRRRLRNGIILTVVFVIAVVAVVAGAIAWVNSQWYVGTDDSRRVIVYQGLPFNVLGVPLRTPVVVDDLTIDELPQRLADDVAAGLPAQNRPDAEAIVTRLKAEAAACAVPRPPAGCPAAEMATGGTAP